MKYFGGYKAIFNGSNILPYYRLITTARRSDAFVFRRIGALGTLLVCSIALEVWGVLLFVPFLTAVVSSSQGNQTAITDLSDIYKSFFRFIAVVGLSALVRSYVVWLNGVTAARIGNKVSRTAFQGVLTSDYLRFVSEDSSKILQRLTGQAGQYTNALSTIFNMFSSLILFIGMIATIGYFNLRVTIVAGMVIFLVYIAINQKSSREQKRIGSQMIQDSQRFIRVIQDSLLGIRDIRFKGNTHKEVDEYSRWDLDIRLNQCRSIFLGSVTRFPLELIGQISVAASALFILSSEGSNDQQLIPTLGGLALGVQKALPAAQSIFAGHSAVMAYSESITGIAFETRRLVESDVSDKSSTDIKTIDLIGVGFEYPDSKKKIHEGLNISFRKGDRIAVVGPSGCGKSTLLDIVTGLLEPTEGNVYINGVDIWSDMSIMVDGWQRRIAYIGQKVHIYSGDLESNIYMEKVREKNRLRYEQLISRFGIAHLNKRSPSNGISDLRDNVQLNVSGGEAQRIGIVRALIRNPDLLVLDEPTNSLDARSKDVLCKEIEMMPKDMAILLVTHDIDFIPSGFKKISIGKSV